MKNRRRIRRGFACAVAVAMLAGNPITATATQTDEQKHQAFANWLSGLTVTRVSPDTSEPVHIPIPQTADELKAHADKVFEIVNQERENAGVPPLERNDYLDEAANTRAQDCASLNDIRFNGQPHTRPDGSRWYTVLGIERNLNYGENLIQGGTAERQMERWMRSDGHRANILREDYTEIGIGVAVSEYGTVYAVQIFYKPTRRR